MRPLIAILSCHAQAEQDQVCRDTWLKGHATDYKFFLGRDPNFGAGGKVPKDDEEFLDCPDDYLSLPFKTQAICGYALRHDCTHLFKCDNDTYVNISRLLASGFAAHDYTGYDWNGCGGYCSGGPGYWLTQKSMAVVEAATFTPDYGDATRRSLRGEDLQVGEALRAAGIMPNGDLRYSLRAPGPEPNNTVITLHDIIRPCKGTRMLEVHSKQ
jgi:hypothetical protein